MPINPAVKAVEQQVRRDRQELKWGGDPETLKIMTGAAAGRTQANAALIDTEKSRVIKRYARSFRRWYGVELPPGEVPVILMKFVLFIYAASACVALLDAGVSAVIGAATFNLEWGPAAAVGALVALGLTVLFKGLCSQLIGRLEERPRKALAVLDIALVAVAAPWAVSFFGSLFIGRFVTSASGDLLFNAAITGLAALSPLLSALLLLCAGIRGWDRAPVRLYQRLEKIERDLAELHAVCKMTGGDGPAPPRHPSKDSGSAFKKAAAVCVIALLMSTAAAAQGLGQVWADKSPSPHVAVLAGALDSAFALLPQIAETAGVGQVELYGFAGDAFDAAPVGPPLHLPLFAPPDCGARSDRATIFKARDKAQACASKIADARNRHDEASAPEIRRGREELARHMPLGAARTCLIDLLARLALPGSGGVRFAIVITDGVETCEPASKDVLPAPPRTMNVVFVLVPGNTSSAVSARRRFQELKRFWEQRAPWLKAVVPGSGLTVDLFRPVAPAPQK